MKKVVDVLIPQAGRESAITARRCVNKPFGCGQPVGEFRDDLSRKEFEISGLCQKYSIFDAEE